MKGTASNLLIEIFQKISILLLFIQVRIKGGDVYEKKGFA